MIVNSFGSSNINKKSADIKYISLIKDLQFKVSKNGDIMSGNLNMNGNKVTHITDPSFNSDVVNKKYVDEAITRANKAEHLEPLKYYTLSTTGLVPDLGVNNDKSGYVVSSGDGIDGEENTNKHLLCYRVFRLGTEWRIKATPTDEFWISVKCTKPVMIYMFTIKPAEGTNLVHWKIQGKNITTDWINLPFSLNAIKSNFSRFEINPSFTKVQEYQEYRLLIKEAEDDNNNPGISHWQLYTINPVQLGLKS
jgi:hypothetical protein